jgi:LPS O-antigen subunit length determinant protein (WzzB/FepE family)
MNKFSESTSSAPSFNINTLPSKNSLKSNVRIDKDKGLLRENLSTITDDGIDAELTISFPKIVSNIDINKEYIEFTNKEILEDFVLKQRDIVTIEIKKLKHQINLQVETLKKQLTFEINKLEHQTSALKVLKSNLNVKKQLLLLHNKLLNQLYNLRLLTVEHRSTDTALLQKKLELEQLENLTFNVSNILSYHMDKSSEILKIDPNRKLVILLGIFFGFFLSTLIILVQISLTIRKELENSLP